MTATTTLRRPDRQWQWERLYIGGEWVRPSTDAALEVRDPATLAVLGRVPFAGAADTLRAVAAARQAFDQGPWPAMALDERVDAVERLLAALSARREELRQLVVSETGLPAGGTALSGTGASQVDGALLLMRNSIEVARSFDFVEEITGLAGRARVRYEPVGVVAAIVPWNGPLWSAMMKLVPALLAGCTVILKPSPLAPLDAMVLAECAEAAGLPPGVLNVVPGDRDAGVALVDGATDKISFTGSTSIGRELAQQCGAKLKRVTLELGGKSAAIVLDDADLDATLPVLLAGGLDNNGEYCTALTRIIVGRGLKDELVERLATAVGNLCVGDPFDPAVDIGPLISARHRERVEHYITAARTDGARVVTGGGRPAEPATGWYLYPAVIDGVTNDMRVAREEIFGPVLAVIESHSTDEAIAIANDSPYGLSGAVFSADPARAVAVADRVRTGTININGFTINIDAPLGGFKESGIGREYGVWGLREFLEPKTINLFDAQV